MHSEVIGTCMYQQSYGLIGRCAKKLMEQTPPRLAYGANGVMMMESIMPSSCIATPTDMMDRGALEEGITQLEELKEEWLGPNEEI